MKWNGIESLWFKTHFSLCLTARARLDLFSQEFFFESIEEHFHYSFYSNAPSKLLNPDLIFEINEYNYNLHGADHL